MSIAHHKPNRPRSSGAQCVDFILETEFLRQIALTLCVDSCRHPLGYRHPSEDGWSRERAHKGQQIATLLGFHVPFFPCVFAPLRLCVPFCLVSPIFNLTQIGKSVIITQVVTYSREIEPKHATRNRTRNQRATY